jgi:DNA-binding NarL/FixJ family response regulator
MNLPRLVLADDHADTRTQLALLLQEDFDVVASVGDGQALVKAVELLSPDVIVTDISMPRLDGIAAAAAIRRKDPAVRIVFVTIHDDPMIVERAFAAGAVGFVRKLAAGDELLSAVHSALATEIQGQSENSRTGVKDPQTGH